MYSILLKIQTRHKIKFFLHCIIKINTNTVKIGLFIRYIMKCISTQVFQTGSALCTTMNNHTHTRFVMEISTILLQSRSAVYAVHVCVQLFVLYETVMDR